MVRYSKYNKDQILQILLAKVSKQEKHCNYQRAIDYAKRMKSYVTGEGQEEYLIYLNKNDTNNQKKQRIKFTNTRTKFLYGRIKNELCKLHTGDKADYNISYNSPKKKDEEAVKKITDRLNIFNNGSSVQMYAQDRIKTLNFIDPNAWIVVKQTPVDDQNTAFSYPFEIPSTCVFNFEQSHGSTQWMISHHIEQVDIFKLKEDAGYILAAQLDKVQDNNRYFNVKGVSNGQTKRPKLEERGRNVYYIYAHNVVYMLREAFKDEQPNANEKSQEIVINQKKTTYFLSEYNATSGQCPAFRVGYIQSDCIGDFYVSLLDKVDKDLNQLIFQQSEYNLTMALHGFLQKFVYAPTCRHKRVSSVPSCECSDPSQCSTCDGKRKYTNVEEYCSGGTYSGSGQTCTKCNGHGKDIHVTVQDIVIVRAPESTKEEVLPINQWVHYVSVPIDQIKHQKECLKELERDIVNCTLSSDIVQKSEVTANDTATGKLLDRQGLQGVMLDLGNQISRFIKFATNIQASYLELGNGIVVDHQYSRNPRVHTLSEKIQERQLAVSANAPQEVIAKIDEQIMLMQCNGDQESINLYKAWEKWRPFSDKSESERLSALAMLDPDNYLNVLYSFFHRIRCEIEIELGDNAFDKLPHKKQKELIDVKVQEFRTYVSGQEEQAPASFPAAPDNENDTPSSGGSRQGNELARSVGGSGLIGQINADVASGKSTRESGINRAMIQLGYDRTTASLLIGVPPTSTPNDDLA